jgi:hypothetical protein
MDDIRNDRLPRLAPLLLAAVLAWLLIFRPGNLEGVPIDSLRLITTLVAVISVGYIAWRFHGLIPAAMAIVLLRYADHPESPYAATVERGGDATLLATLAICIGAMSRQGRSGRLPWLLLGIATLGVAALGWFDSYAPAQDAVARDRIRHVTMAVVAFATVFGFLGAGTWLDRLKLIAVVVGGPAAGIVAARLIHGDWPRLLEGGDWPSVISEWRTTLSDGTWAAGSWCWTTAWFAATLVLIGLWRTIARGRREWQQGLPPMACLIAVASIGAVAALNGRLLATGSLALAGVMAVLSVFGIADLIQALVERIELKPPEPNVK